MRKVEPFSLRRAASGRVASRMLSAQLTALGVVAATAIGLIAYFLIR